MSKARATGPAKLTQCECCGERFGRMRKVAGSDPPVGARLCNHCADRGHGSDVCLVCTDHVWFCARQGHFAFKHPTLLANLEQRAKEGLPVEAPTGVRFVGKINL